MGTQGLYFMQQMLMYIYYAAGTQGKLKCHLPGASRYMATLQLSS